MRYLKAFENFNPEFPINEPSKGLYLLENLMDSAFINDITGKNNLIKGRDYELLNVEEDHFNKCYFFKIIVYNINNEFISLLENNYQLASNFYNQYVKDNGYKMAVITIENNNTISFGMQS